MKDKKIRIYLMGAVIMVALVITAFMVLVNMARIQELTNLVLPLTILIAFMLILLILYFWKGSIYDENGQLEKNRILTMTTTIFIIAQATFAFATYANQKMIMSFEAVKDSKQIYKYFDDYYAEHESFNGIENVAPVLIDNYPEFDAMFISFYDKGNYYVVKPLYGDIKMGTGFSQRDVSIHTFPIATGYLCIKESADYENTKTWDVLSELLTVMAASIFLTLELMMFVMKIIDEKVNPAPIINGKKPIASLSYVRQLAFLFYFASFLPGAFISVMAKALGGSLFGITGNVLAGIPQSAETLLTCTAIFATSVLIEKKGWKLPFMWGLLLVAVGTFCTALAPNILIFILARAMVGLGYGFCWMTFRNLSLFGRNEEEKTTGFSLLNAGLYAGINCGSVLGAVLADSIGYNMVLYISAGFTILCSISILRMENLKYKKPVIKEEREGKIPFAMWSVLVMYIVLMIAPTCIAGAYMSYYLPLYFTSIGRGVADAGRAQLLYGVLVIYAGPALANFVGKHSNYFLWNIAYNVIIGSAFVVFGLMGHFLPAFIAVIILSIGDSFGFGVQNLYFTRIEAVKKMGESMSMSLVSFLKKMAEMLGPICFGLVMTGAGTMPVAILGGVFIVCAIVYYVRVQYLM